MKRKGIVAIGFILLIVAPMAGGLVRGLRPGFFDYPPLVTSPPIHAPFSWGLWALFAAILAGAMLLVARPRWFGFGGVELERRPAAARMPWWGGAGLALTVLAWIGAWGRFAWMGFMRDHMFAPLWFGYVFTMDGLAYRRKGSSMASRNPRIFALFFPASAAAWWYFEYLNRFVQNWWYEGIGHFGPGHYVFYSCICFSTVFPALFATHEWLTSFSYFDRSFRKGPRWRPLPRGLIRTLPVVGALALAVIGYRPDPFFFLTWVAPWIVMEGVLAIAGVPTAITELKDGDYSMLFNLGLAALICGFFWEMWNFHALPKWNYSVPYVQRFHVFEMPIVGYGGYLPFGPACYSLWVAMARALAGRNSKLETGNLG